MYIYAYIHTKSYKIQNDSFGTNYDKNVIKIYVINEPVRNILRRIYNLILLLFLYRNLVTAVMGI